MKQEDKDLFFRLMKNFGHGLKKPLMNLELIEEDGTVWSDSDELMELLQKYHQICVDIHMLTNVDPRMV